MYILGLQGSPRKNGNTSKLLSTFLSEAESLGAHTHLIDVPRKNIKPCRSCGNCEKKGFCPIDDDMQQTLPLLRKADLIVLGTPVFFYGATAQLKCLIDRSQVLWARKYVHHLEDPGRKWRQGFFLSVGATKGADLFDGISLTAKYFFDAIGAGFAGSLTYRKIEGPNEVEEHPTALSDTKEKARGFVIPSLGRKKILFVCIGNTCRSQMASAFAQYYAGDKYKIDSAGSAPEKEINSIMIDVMGEKGIDMAYRIPQSLDDAAQYRVPDLIITMGCGDTCPMYPGVETITWNLPDPAKKSIEFMRGVRDEIEKKVKSLIASFD